MEFKVYYAYEKKERMKTNSFSRMEVEQCKRLSRKLN